MSNLLNISEDFYSVQAEGDSTGVPAYFIRLKGCNLSCGISSKQIIDIKRAGKGNIPHETFIGDLHESGKATWTCDSALVWLFGDAKPFEYLVDRWKEQNVLDNIIKGKTHLVWSGGEPTVHQNKIVDFLNWFQEQYPHAELYNEVETNGTITMTDEFSDKMHQINCSVKLQNSGMSKERRIKRDALNKIIAHPNYWFKFVVSLEEDLIEIKNDFVNEFDIEHKRILMMPGLDDQDDFHERTRFILELAKKSGYRGLTRLHISAYNKVTGV